MSFLNEIKYQFGFSILLNSHGILHQSTCPRTPQQNGIAERKNRHLVETTHTLLLGANVLVHYWGDAILSILLIKCPLLLWTIRFHILLTGLACGFCWALCVSYSYHSSNVFEKFKFISSPYHLPTIDSSNWVVQWPKVSPLH